MQSVRLHIDGAGQVWAMSRCRECGEVDKHLLERVMAGTVPCRKCGHAMDIAGATIVAAESRLPAKDSPLRTLVKQALERDGLPGAVRELNAGVPHRYTGIFVKEGGMLRNIALFDKQNENPNLWHPFPLGNSFCSLIIAGGAALTIHEASTDVRAEVKYHPAEKIVQAYCGVPLIDAEGSVRGTLCHFDDQAVAIDIDMGQMLLMPALLKPYLAL
jgi:hypothetical protein